MSFRNLFLILVVLFWMVSKSEAQVIQPSYHTRDYYDLLALYNSNMPKPISIHPSIISQYQVDTVLQWNIWKGQFDIPLKSDKKLAFNWVNPYLNYSMNTATPRGYNDGAIWAGKGSNIAVSAGFMGHIGILHFAFVPIVTSSQNKSIVIPENVTNNSNISPYSYPFSNRIDWVQQYGQGAYNQFNLGQSEVRLVYKKATIGLSTENIKWGPSIWNPILMSMNATGLPHIDFGTAAPINTKIGKVEAKWYWGVTQESKYFDNNPDNDRKYVTGFSIGYEPKIIPGLSLGLNRVMYTRWNKGDLSTADIYASVNKNKSKGRAKNDEYDQMASVMLKYRLPAVGLELYMEYAKNDFPGNFSDWFKQLDRTRAVSLGLMKTFELNNNRLLVFNYEFTNLSANQTQALPQNASPTYYIHSVVENGYTQEGQIIGAGIGPGSNGSIAKVSLFNPKGKVGFTYSRIRFDDDYFMNRYKNLPEPYPNDFEISLGLDYVRYFKSFTIQPMFMWNFRKNWYYQDEIVVSNYQLALQVQYNLGY